MNEINEVRQRDCGHKRVLVTGATGYVGGRLVPALLEAGYEVTCLARTPTKLDSAAWRDRVEVLTTPVGEVQAADLEGIDAAFYVVHAIGTGEDWAEREQSDARAFANAAKAGGVKHIVYLGGLGDESDALSVHLSSRHEVGRILRESSLLMSELRAGVIIGSGSASCEMLRHLVEVLPVMTTPRWVETRCQPVAISDVIATLVAALEVPTDGVFELGGADVVSYAEMMKMYSSLRGLPERRLVKVPFLTPGLSSHSPAALSDALIESFAWLEFLPAKDRASFGNEFARVVVASSDIDNYEPVAQVIREWRATAEILAVPSLAKRLRSSIDAAGEFIREPVA